MVIRVRIFRAVLAAGLLVSAPIGMAVTSAGPAAAAADLALSPEFAHAFIGNGVLDQQIVIPGDSSLIGSDTAIAVGFDPAAADFSASVDAGNEAGAVCGGDPVNGFTCTAPAGGWTPGNLDADYDTGGSPTAIPACGLQCNFDIYLYEGSVGGTLVESSGVTIAAPGALSATLLQQSADTAVLTVDNAGPNLDAYFTVQVTGLAGYSVAAAPAGSCTQSGAQLNCNYSAPLLGSNNAAVAITLTFTGGSGPVDLAAAVSGYILDAGGISVGTGDSASATLDWTPGQQGSTTGSSSGSSSPGSGSGAGGGSTGKAGTSTQSNMKPASAAGSAAANASGAASGSASAQAGSSGSALAGGSASDQTQLGGVGKAASSSGLGNSGNMLMWGFFALALVIAGGAGGWFYVARRRTKAAYAAAAAYVPPVLEPESENLDERERGSFESSAWRASSRGSRSDDEL